MIIARHIPRVVAGLLQLCLLTALYWLFAPRFWYDFGPDFVSYSAIAQQYAAGNFTDAVNSWWSPLYSWLLAGVQVPSGELLCANKVLQFVAAAGGWWLVRQLLYFHVGSAKRWATELLVTATIPFWIYWGLRSDTPDLISAVLLLRCFYGVLQLHRDYSKRQAITTGVFAGVAYLAKSYNFYFIAVFGVILLLVLLVKGPQRRKGSKIFLQWLAVAVPFVVICFVWMCILFQKTGQWQVSSIAQHNPCTNSYVKAHKAHPGVYDCAGLQLHTGSLISDWEQPGLYSSVPVKQHLLQQPQQAARNWLQHLWYYLRDFSSAWLWLLLVILLVVCRGELRTGWLYLLWYGIYVSGYLLLHLEARFFIMPAALVMIMVGWLLVTAIQKWQVPLLWPVAVAVTILLFARWPLHNLFSFDSHTKARQVYALYQQQKVMYPKPMHIAAAAGLFDEGLYYSFYGGHRFYGALTGPVTDTASQRQLRDQRIDYVFETTLGQ